MSDINHTDSIRRRLNEQYMRIASVNGWIWTVDAWAMLETSCAQIDLGIEGNLFEFGAFYGKTAIVLGYVMRDSEILHVCDIFDSPTNVSAINAADNRYPPVTKDDFLENYHYFHARPPVIHSCPSHALTDDDIPAGSFRLVHVDGGHDYESAAGDLDRALRMICDGGVIVIDDYVNKITPAVGAACWERVASGALVPFLGTGAKLYAVRSAAYVEQYQGRLIAAMAPGARKRLIWHELYSVRYPLVGQPFLGSS